MKKRLLIIGASFSGNGYVQDFNNVLLLAIANEIVNKIQNIPYEKWEKALIGMNNTSLKCRTITGVEFNVIFVWDDKTKCLMTKYKPGLKVFVDNKEEQIVLIDQRIKDEIYYGIDIVRVLVDKIKERINAMQSDLINALQHDYYKVEYVAYNFAVAVCTKLLQIENGSIIPRLSVIQLVSMLARCLESIDPVWFYGVITAKEYQSSVNRFAWEIDGDKVSFTLTFLNPFSGYNVESESIVLKPVSFLWD